MGLIVLMLLNHKERESYHRGFYRKQGWIERENVFIAGGLNAVAGGGSFITFPDYLLFCSRLGVMYGDRQQTIHAPCFSFRLFHIGHFVTK